MKLFFKKKAITGYPRSFAKRLTWRIMLRMIIIMIIPVLLLFWITYGIVALGVTGISDRILKGERRRCGASPPTSTWRPSIRRRS